MVYKVIEYDISNRGNWILPFDDEFSNIFISKFIAGKNPKSTYIYIQPFEM